MKFDITKSSNYKFIETAEINTLEDLKAVYDKYCEKPKLEICWEPRLIIDFREQYIEIYDDWRE